jgi:hypothetical protein
VGKIVAAALLSVANSDRANIPGEFTLHIIKACSSGCCSITLLATEGIGKLLANSLEQILSDVNLSLALSRLVS